MEKIVDKNYFWKVLSVHYSQQI